MLLPRRDECLPLSGRLIAFVDQSDRRTRTRFILTIPSGNALFHSPGATRQFLSPAPLRPSKSSGSGNSINGFHQPLQRYHREQIIETCSSTHCTTSARVCILPPFGAMLPPQPIGFSSNEHGGGVVCVVPVFYVRCRLCPISAQQRTRVAANEKALSIRILVLQ